MTYYNASTIAAKAAILFTLAFSTGCGYVRFPYIAPPATPPPPVSKLAFGYVASALTHTISQFQISSAGLWNPLSPTSVLTGILPESLAVDPSGRFVYVVSYNDSTVSQYIINLATGVLTPNNPATLPTGAAPQWMAIDPLGRFLYTANTHDSTISVYRIDEISGALTPTIPATAQYIPTSGGDSPYGLVFDPSGRFLYAVGGGTAETFAIDAATGLLTQTGAILYVGGGNFPVAIDPAGNFLYIPSNYRNEVEVVAIDPATGALSPAAVPSVPAGEGVSSVVLDPTGRFLYAVNRREQSISQFTVGLRGSLKSMSVPVVQDPGLPWQILVDPSGELAYVSNEATASVTIYRIGADGALNQYSSAAAGEGAGGMGVARRR